MKFNESMSLGLSDGDIISFELFIDNLERILDRYPNPGWASQLTPSKEYSLKRDIGRIAFDLFKNNGMRFPVPPDETDEFELRYVLEIKNWAVRALSELTSNKQGNNEGTQSSSLPIDPEIIVKPSWDPTLQELAFNGVSVKKWNRPAKNQIAIIEVFHNADAMPAGTEPPDAFEEW